MRLEQFGDTQLRVSRFGLGGARLGGVFQRDGSAFADLIAAARHAGINFFDTADIYSQGESEALIGRVLRHEREKVIIATKAGYRLPTQRRLAGRIKPLIRPLIRLLKVRRDRLPAAVRGSLSQDFSPAYLRKAVEASLRRLKTDYIDLLQLHSPSAEALGKEAWTDALDALKRAGKLRYYGVSCDDEPAGLAALSFPGISSLQVRLSLIDEDAAATLIPRAQARGIGVIARECLANGLLVKPADQVDLAKYCASSEEAAIREQQLAALRVRADREGVSLAGLAMRYAGGVAGVSVVLLGASSTRQLEDLLRAAG